MRRRGGRAGRAAARRAGECAGGSARWRLQGPARKPAKRKESCQESGRPGHRIPSADGRPHIPHGNDDRRGPPGESRRAGPPTAWPDRTGLPTTSRVCDRGFEIFAMTFPAVLRQIGVIPFVSQHTTHLSEKPFFKGEKDSTPAMNKAALSLSGPRATPVGGGSRRIGNGPLGLEECGSED